MARNLSLRAICSGLVGGTLSSTTCTTVLLHDSSTGEPNPGFTERIASLDLRTPQK